MKKKKRNLGNVKLRSLGLILGSFLLIILIGTLLLWLPISKKTGCNDFHFLEAFFTATSAVCVTGLSPVQDISTCLNVFGRIVLAILIEIGGLGFITVVMFIAVLFGAKVSFGQRMLLKEALNSEYAGGIVKLLKRIVITSFIIQTIGFILNFIDFYFLHNQLVASLGVTRSLTQLYFDEAVGLALFHSISSFNNAGFDLFGSTSLLLFKDDLLLNISTSLMVVCGGLGFIVIFDLCKNKFNIKKLSVHSKIVIMMTLVLLIAPTFLFKLIEGDKLTLLQSFFLSMTTRTAGFSTCDLSSLSDTSIMFICFLMFFGAAPAGTGGGVKITTLFAIIWALKSFAIGENQTHIFRRKLPEGQIIKAFILSVFAFGICLIAAMVVSACEDSNLIYNTTFRDIVFESISAFGTVGLSINGSYVLNKASKIVLIFIMYFGRLGPITFISLFNRNSSISKDDVMYLEENIIIG